MEMPAEAAVAMGLLGLRIIILEFSRYFKAWMRKQQNKTTGACLKAKRKKNNAGLGHRKSPEPQFYPVGDPALALRVNF